MTKIKFNIIERDEYTILHFELVDPILPETLKSLNPPKINPTKGIILSGRGPIWLYCYLTHHYHPTKFIATYDPRLGGAVIIESHSPQHKTGEIIKINTPNK